MKTSVKSFVNINYIKKHKLLTISLIKLYKFKFIDDKLISNFIYLTRFQFTFKNYIEKL